MSSYRFCSMHNLFLHTLLIKNVSSSTSQNKNEILWLCNSRRLAFFSSKFICNTILIKFQWMLILENTFFFIKLMSKKVFFMFRNLFIKCLYEYNHGFMILIFHNNFLSYYEVWPQILCTLKLSVLMIILTYFHLYNFCPCFVLILIRLVISPVLMSQYLLSSALGSGFL